MDDKQDTVLLVNTYTDAGQTIESLDFNTVFTTFADAPLTVLGEMAMQITEIGGTYFYEKLIFAIQGLGLSGVGDVVFALSIDFVGRTPDDQVEMVEGPIMKLVMIGVDGDFDVRGATYSCKFVCTEYGAHKVNEQDAKIRKNLCLTGRTIGELFTDFQEKINREIETSTEKDVVRETKGRRLIYEFDPGFLKDFEVNSFVKGANLNQENATMRTPNPGNGGQPVMVSSAPNTKFVEIINDIIKQSPKATELVAASTAEVGKPGHGKSVAYKIVTSYASDEQYVLYRYAIEPFYGRDFVLDPYGQPQDVDFVFYFNYTGLNVDVLTFNMKLERSFGFILDQAKNLSTYTDLTNTSEKPVEQNTNDESTNVVDRKDPATQKLSIGKFDCVRPPVYTDDEANGLMKATEHDAKSLRRHMDVVANISGTPGNQFAAKIRGHLDLLFGSTGKDRNSPQAGFNHPLQVKMIVRNGNGEQYWYNGSYIVNQVRNTFAGGQFTQDIVGFADGMNTERTRTAVESAKQEMAGMQDKIAASVAALNRGGM
jgi:hypothetical protein